MTTTSSRTIGIFISIFLLSALTTYTFRTTHHPRSHRHSTTSSGSTPRYAFATFLAANANPDRAPTDVESEAILDIDDGYFLSTRVLTYQLLHSPVTSTNQSIPFIVLCTADVSARKRARLARDGATVVLVDKVVTPSWVTPGDARWADVMAKLRLWELLDGRYDKVAFMDGDTLVTSRLDDVFHDEATISLPVLEDKVAPITPITSADDDTGNPSAANRRDTPSHPVLPRSYMLASHVDYFSYTHPYPPAAPPSPDASSYFNVGFFVLRPSRLLFAYYMSLLTLSPTDPATRLFDPTFPEQNLLNYAHRSDGPMPWARLWPGWNVNWPTEQDWRNGVRTFHAKYWDSDPGHDVRLKQVWREQRAEMEGYWRGREGDTRSFLGRKGWE